MKKSLMEDKRRRGPTLVRTPKGTSHWWVCCCDVKWWPFAALFGLKACDCGQWGSEWDEILSFGNFFLKVYIQSPVSDFVILKLYLILDGLILLCKGDFCCKVCPCDVFWRRHFRRCAQDMGQSLLKQYDHTVWYADLLVMIANVRLFY